MESYDDKYNDIQLERILRENAEKRTAYSKSIGTNKRTSYQEKKKSNGKPAILITMAALLVAAGISAPKVIERVNYANDLEKATAIVEEIAYDNLSNTGLIFTDPNGNSSIKLGGNDISDYSVLNKGDATPVELYAYDKALEKAGDTTHSEFEKLVMASSYNDGTYNYVSFSQYCTVNGFTDSEKNPSGLEFRKFAKDELVKSYRNGTIDNIMTQVIDESRGK